MFHTHRAVVVAAVALFFVVGLALAPACGGEKKKPKPKPIKIVDLKIKFKNDLGHRFLGVPDGTKMSKVKGVLRKWFAKPTSVIRVSYTIKNVKLRGGEAALKQVWKLRKAAGGLIWKYKVTQSKKVKDEVDGKNVHVNRRRVLTDQVIKPGNYTLEVKVSDTLAEAATKIRVKIKKDSSLDVKAVAKPKGYLTLPDNKLHILGPKGARVVQDGGDFAKDQFKYKGLTLWVQANYEKPSKAMVLSRVNKAAKKEQDHKVKNSGGKGNAFFIEYNRKREGQKKKKKRTYFYVQHLMRRDQAWVCKGQTDSKKLAKRFKEFCDSLK